ncbi:hypothetical protein [Collimonas fungivorans]|uniref:hypothetical protein n=1 Tax=Collimonas fungivorans TaxID=158899 RepID=UPI000778767B|nr:hypothetical protein [Collimonas fungivorans]
MAFSAHEFQRLGARGFAFVGEKSLPVKTASFYTKKSGAGFAVTAMAIVTVVLPERTGKYRRAHLNWISLTLIAMVICFQRRL